MYNERKQYHSLASRTAKRSKHKQGRAPGTSKDGCTGSEPICGQAPENEIIKPLSSHYQITIKSTCKSLSNHYQSTINQLSKTDEELGHNDA